MIPHPTGHGRKAKSEEVPPENAADSVRRFLARPESVCREADGFLRLPCSSADEDMIYWESIIAFRVSRDICLPFGSDPVPLFFVCDAKLLLKTLDVKIINVKISKKN